MQKKALFIKVVATTPSKASSFASTVTRMETTLNDANGVWQKDRGGKFNNYLNVDIEVQDSNGRIVDLGGYVDVEAVLMVVLEDDQLGEVVDRVDRKSKRVMNKHLEGNHGKLMIIDADPVTGAGLRIGGSGRTTIKTRINELSKKGSRNSRFSVIYRPVGPGSERFIVDDVLARSQPLTIYSKVVKSLREEAMSSHLEQAKLAAKTLLSEVEKVDPSEACGNEAEVVMEILEACRLIQRKLQWQQDRAAAATGKSPSNSGAAASGNGKGASLFEMFNAAFAASNSSINQLPSSSSSSANQLTTNSTFTGEEEDDDNDNDDGDDAEVAAAAADAAAAVDSMPSPLMTFGGDAKRPRLGQMDWSSGRLNVVCSSALGDIPEDFSLDILEDFILSKEQDDGTVNVGTDLRLTETGITISLFDENMDGSINRDEMERGIARLDIPLTPEMHRRIFEEFDVNKDGVITIEEFIQGVKKKEAELLPLFNQLDKDGDGFLTFEELRTSKILQSVPSEAIQELIAFVDSLSTEEPDGRISKKEFLSTFTMLPSGENLESLQHFAHHVSQQQRSKA